MWMFYDDGRAKWLSIESTTISYGKAKDTATGAYFRGLDGLAYSATLGWRAPHNGTIVEAHAQRSNAVDVTHEVTEGGTTRASLALSTAAGATDATFNADFTAAGILAVRNSAGSSGNSKDTHGWVRVRWRV
jgi:hypothetical protein